jgi:hypothetical protein
VWKGRVNTLSIYDPRNPLERATVKSEGCSTRVLYTSIDYESAGSGSLKSCYGSAAPRECSGIAHGAAGTDHLFGEILKSN